MHSIGSMLSSYDLLNFIFGICVRIQLIKCKGTVTMRGNRSAVERKTITDNNCGWVSRFTLLLVSRVHTKMGIHTTSRANSFEPIDLFGGNRRRCSFFLHCMRTLDGWKQKTIESTQESKQKWAYCVIILRMHTLTYSTEYHNKNNIFNNKILSSYVRISFSLLLYCLVEAIECRILMRIIQSIVNICFRWFFS